MAFIRKREEEKTGFQSSYKNGYEWDFAADFAMVYGIGDSMMETIDSFKKTGHVIHLMTGISWGSYRDYLEGRWDGEEHMDEAQEDRFGNKIMHGLKGITAGCLAGCWCWR